MRRKLTQAGLVLFGVLGFTGPGFADSDYACKSGQTGNWLGKELVREDLTSKGFEVRKIETENGCYEVYALKDGKRLEVFVNPQTGDVEQTVVK